jgi:hypothetical protein
VVRAVRGVWMERLVVVRQVVTVGVVGARGIEGPAV